MAWRKRMAEQKNAAAGGGADAVGPSGSGEQAKAPNLATSVDKIDFFGSTGGGGTLTRDGMKNAQKTRSKAIDAMEQLVEACKLTGDVPPEAAAEELSRVIGAAYEAGVSVTAPPMRKAAALLTALEAAREGASSQTQPAGADDALDRKLDALFSGFAPPPEPEL